MKIFIVMGQCEQIRYNMQHMFVCFVFFVEAQKWSLQRTLQSCSWHHNRRKTGRMRPVRWNPSIGKTCVLVTSHMVNLNDHILLHICLCIPDSIIYSHSIVQCNCDVTDCQIYSIYQFLGFSCPIYRIWVRPSAAVLPVFYASSRARGCSPFCFPGYDTQADGHSPPTGNSQL